MKNKIARPAIAMIELIFSIVIMGIVLMSAPMLISTASSSVSVALQQEGVNEAASKVNIILTYSWDQNDVNATSVLHVIGGSAQFEANSSNGGERIGVPYMSGGKHRTFKLDNGSEYNASTTLGKEGSNTDDMDDFNGDTIALTSYSSGSGGTDYIEKGTVTMSTVVSYKTPNIKEINVTLSSSSSEEELSKNIVFSAFSCNIGGTQFESRQIP